jgi:hypothetical protein
MDLLTRIDSLWGRCHFPNPDGLKLLGVRGLTMVEGEPVVSHGQPDLFSDTLFVFDLDTRQVDHLPCTTQARTRVAHARPEAPRWSVARYGCAHYARGLHVDHRRRHQALRQARGAAGVWPVLCGRGGGTVSCADARLDEFGYVGAGLTIAAAGSRPGRAGSGAEGHTVVAGDWAAPPWRTLRRNLDESYARQGWFPYAMVPAEWLLDGATTQRLLWGSEGQPVLRLQQVLREEEGIWLNYSGRFDEPTDRAYRRYQRDLGRAGDGVCVDPPWLVPAQAGVG